eukprot:6198565-Pleurochrysis_carterae.AAC.1
MQAQRSRLPAASRKDQVIAALRSSAVLVISGETGCGKTTQVPQVGDHSKCSQIMHALQKFRPHAARLCTLHKSNTLTYMWR